MSSFGTHLWFTQNTRVFDQSIARPCRPASALSTLRGHGRGGGITLAAADAVPGACQAADAAGNGGDGKQWWQARQAGHRACMLPPPTFLQE